MPSDDAKLMIKLLRDSQLSKEDGLLVIRAIKATAQLETAEVIDSLNARVETQDINPEDAEAGKKKGTLFGDPIVILGR